MLDYLDLNRFDELYRGPGDSFFGSLAASRPEIYPIYWSRAQMEARQSDEMATVQSFLNRLWQFERSDGTNWFDPDVSIIYPDRIRRRPPGTCSRGLGAHTDSGALERWLLPAYQQVFASIFRGDIAAYDPWDAAHRTEVEEYSVENTTKCSVFRTFQGWTALSDMLPGQGLLHVVPIPEAMAYVLLRPLQPGWGNVMYIPAAPRCEKNMAYASLVRQALEQGASPGDFPHEDYEADWQGRFTLADLNDHGRRALGMLP